MNVFTPVVVVAVAVVVVVVVVMTAAEEEEEEGALTTEEGLGVNVDRLLSIRENESSLMITDGVCAVGEGVSSGLRAAAAAVVVARKLPEATEAGRDKGDCWLPPFILLLLL